MPACSLIVFKGDSRAKTEDEFEHALNAGVEFIKLRHDPSSPNAVESARGFQAVHVTVVEGQQGQITYNVEYSNKDGVACRGLRPLVFHPEGRTREVVAWLPDTPFNRDKLAMYERGVHVGDAGFIKTSFWKIADGEVSEDVRARAMEMRKTAPQGPTKDEMIMELNRRLEEAENEKAKLEREKAIAEQSRRTLAEIQIHRQKNADLSDEQLKAIYAEVHDEQIDLVDRLKAKHGEKWESSNEYKKTIQPLVDARIAEEKEALRGDSDSGESDN